MENRLCLALCSNFGVEAAAVLASEGFPDVECVSFSAECGRSMEDWARLRRTLPANGKRRLCAVGGPCLAALESVLSTGDDCRVQSLERCLYAVAGKKIVDRYLEEGSFLLTPGWLSRWNEAAERPGFDRDAAGCCFTNTATRVVLLDTGIDPESLVKLEDLSAFLKLPFESVPVGLDHFRLFLTRTVLEWRLEAGKQSPAKSARMLGNKNESDSSDYRDRCLQLGQTLAGVCGLAVSSARDCQLLREEKQNMRAYLQAAGAIFLAIAPDRRVLLINARGCEILGCEEREVVGRNWFEDFVPEAGRGKVEAVFTRLMEGRSEDAELIEGFVKTRDGSERTIAWYNTLLRDDAGRAKAALWSGEDITDRRRMEEALKESEARFRSLSESAPIGIFQVDAGGCCVYTNARWQQIAGLTLKESLGDGWTRALHPKDREVVLAMWRKSVSDGCEASGKYRFLTPQGEVRWVSAHMAPIRSGTDRSRGHVGTVEEITERRRMEEELIRAKKLEATGLLAGGMAHDFNNLLSIILGNISLVQMNRNPRDESLKLLDNVEKACLEARRLTQQFITFAGGGKPTLMTVSTRALLKEAFERALAGSHVTCELHVDEGLPWLSCDPAQMRQALVNLIVNGREAMGGEGMLKISACRLPLPPPGVPSLSRGNRAVISISDAGTGIAEEHLARIFDPYFSTRQRGSQKGMGLGLTVAYSIVKAHEGDITVTSGVGEGTTFYVYLPAPSESGVGEGDSPQKPADAKRRVLLVDEEELFRKVARRMIERIGYEAESAKDGNEAIELSRIAAEAGVPFDVVILDLNILRGMGGREALRALLKMNPSLKAVVSGARAEDPLVSRWREFGFRGAILKPFAIKELNEILRKVISGAG